MMVIIVMEVVKRLKFVILRLYFHFFKKQVLLINLKHLGLFYGNE
jgi:hypothetical protein